MARPRKYIQAEIDAAIALWDEGELSARGVSEALSMSYYSVRRALREAGRDLDGERRIPRGAKHHSWTGGTYTNNRGYVVASFDEEWLAPMAISSTARRGRRQALEHRLVMARHLKRLLSPVEQVHHKNGDRTDNRLENLQLRQVPHGPGSCFECGDCGSKNIQPVELEN